MSGRDTIAAIATPPGVGGIGVIRVSGPDAESLAREITGDLPQPRHASFCAFISAFFFAASSFAFISAL